MITMSTTTPTPTYSIFLFFPPAVAGWFGGLGGVASGPAGAGEAGGGSGAGAGGSEVVGGAGGVWVGGSAVGFI